MFKTKTNISVAAYSTAVNSIWWQVICRVFIQKVARTSHQGRILWEYTQLSAWKPTLVAYRFIDYAIHWMWSIFFCPNHWFICEKSPTWDTCMHLLSCYSYSIMHVSQVLHSCYSYSVIFVLTLALSTHPIQIMCSFINLYTAVRRVRKLLSIIVMNQQLLKWTSSYRSITMH